MSLGPILHSNNADYRTTSEIHSLNQTVSVQKPYMTEEHIDVVAGIIQKGNRVLVSKRPPDTHLGGYWEFPGGKPEAGESDTEALHRELQEEIGISVSVEKPYFSVTHEYDERTVHIEFYMCRKNDDATPKPLECEAVQWVDRQNLSSLSFPSADKEILKKLRNESVEST